MLRAPWATSLRCHGALGVPPAIVRRVCCDATATYFRGDLTALVLSMFKTWRRPWRPCCDLQRCDLQRCYGALPDLTTTQQRTGRFCRSQRGRRPVWLGYNWTWFFSRIQECFSMSFWLWWIMQSCGTCKMHPSLSSLKWLVTDDFAKHTNPEKSSTICELKLAAAGVTDIGPGLTFPGLFINIAWMNFDMLKSWIWQTKFQIWWSRTVHCRKL